jgi:S-adenosyl-L-methionine hydrolase (adenosine-forming)
MVAYDWITLTTDYGLSDGYTGVLHGVIAQHAPWVRVIDVTHQVPPGDVSRGAAVLAQAVGHLPLAVHVGVVDPGVGTGRRAVGIETPCGLLVGPDNGLLTGAADALGGVRAAVRLTDPTWFLPEVSMTFHGRDIFAPVAARLAAGVPLADAGPAIEPQSLVRLPEPICVVGDGYLEAEVLTVDRFGNVQLAASGTALDRLGTHLEVGGVRATRASTFADGQPGRLIAYVDSAGKVALAVNGGRAVVALSVSPGDVLRMNRRD